MQRPANDDPIVRPEHFIDIEAGILQSSGDLLTVAFGALNAAAWRFVTVVDIVVSNDLAEDSLVLLVVSIVKTLNRVEIPFVNFPWRFASEASRDFERGGRDCS